MARLISALRRGLAAVAVLAAASGTAEAGLVYATNLDGRTISVIDTATNTIVAQPDIGGVSYLGTGVLPNGNFAYVATANPNRIAVLDTVTHAVVASIDTTLQPWNIVALPDSSRIYAADNTAGEVLVIDAATNTLVTTITAIPRPYGIAAAPDGSKVYVASFADTAVAIVDTATNSVTSSIDLSPSSPASLDLSPDGSKLYVMLRGVPAVAVYDTTTLTRTALLPLSGNVRGLAVSRDGTKVYVANVTSASVIVLDEASGTQTASIPVGSGPIGVALDQTGAQLYVTSASGSVSVIDTTTETVIASIGPLPETNSLGNFVTPDLSLLTLNTANGRVTAGLATGPQLACTGTCRRNYAVSTTITLTAEADAGHAFAGWSGDCAGTVASITLAMSAARSCTAGFTQLPPPPPAPPPPPPVPGWFNETAPPPQLATTVGLDGQFRSASLAPLFSNPAELSFSVSQPDGSPLPAGIVFDPVSLTFSGLVRLADRPVQSLPGADQASPRIPNPVFPATATLSRLPVVVTARDKSGASYSITQYLDLQTPREPVAMAALSVSRDGLSGGNAASSAPALSYDGGQIVFQSAASNLVTTASPVGTDVLRYHTLAGRLDRLNQSAFPGGGPSGGTLGPALNPSVSEDGRYAAFSASGQGLVLGLDTKGKRQIYRIGLKHPRVDLDPATPTAELVSATPDGAAGDNHSDNPVLSADGRYVTFVSRAANLVPGLDGTARIWRKDMATGALLAVSAADRPAADPAMTADGRQVAFAAGGLIHVRNLETGLFRTVEAGTSPRLSASGDTLVFVASGSVIALRGDTRIVLGDGTQPTVSADGRFVAWRTSAGQIQVSDIMRGVSALVSRTADGQPGNGHSSDPAVAGDGRSIAFATNARNLVGGKLATGQIMLAGNPLVDPGGTRYWQVTSGSQQVFAVERRGDRAYVASLTYDGAGNPTWTAGFCSFAGLTCNGAGFAFVFAENGTDATLGVGQASLGLQAFALGGSTRHAMPGLPEAGWWYDADNPGSGTGWFLATATPDANGIPGTPIAMLAGAIYDAAGRPFWAAAQGAFTGNSLSATLNRYDGGAPPGQPAVQAPSASPLGPVAITWTGPRSATAVMPNGQRANLVRWPF